MAVWLLIFGTIVTALGLWRFMKGEVTLQPVKVLGVTTFEKPEQIGAVLFRRFWQDLHEKKLVMLASSPALRDSQRVWQGFLAVAKENKIEFTRVFREPHVAENEAYSREAVQHALAQGERVLVYLPSTDQSWLEASTFSDKAFKVFESVLPASEAERAGFQALCRPEDKNFQLSCKAATVLLGARGKKPDPAQLSAVIETHGLDAHVLFVHERPQ